MTIRRFISDDTITGDTVRITGDEFHHLKNVNRAKCGDQIEVIDGRGSLFTGEITALKSHEAIVAIREEEKTPKSKVSVIIAPSLLKQQPMNLMIEKLTELGVDEIRPVIFRRTDDTYNPSRLTKWRRIALQTLKVNKRLWVTEIYPPSVIEELIETASGVDVKSRILLDIMGQNRAGIPGQFPVISVIGPPGGIMDEERDRLTQNGFIPYKINDCILKTETAAISIAALLTLSIEGPSVNRAA